MLHRSRNSGVRIPKAGFYSDSISEFSQSHNAKRIFLLPNRAAVLHHLHSAQLHGGRRTVGLLRCRSIPGVVSVGDSRSRSPRGGSRILRNYEDPRSWTRGAKVISSTAFERRVFRIGMWLVAAGTIVTATDIRLEVRSLFSRRRLLSARESEASDTHDQCGAGSQQQDFHHPHHRGLHPAPVVDSPVPLCYYALLFFRDYCCNCRICGFQQRHLSRRHFRSG